MSMQRKSLELMCLCSLIRVVLLQTRASIIDSCRSSSTVIDKKVFESVVVESINSLRCEIGELRSEL